MFLVKTAILALGGSLAIALKNLFTILSLTTIGALGLNLTWYLATALLVMATILAVPYIIANVFLSSLITWLCFLMSQGLQGSAKTLHSSAKVTETSSKSTTNFLAYILIIDF
jgi:hypothetical protein